MKRLLLLFSLLVFPILAGASDKEKVYLSLEIFQTLDKNSALARTEDWNIVKIETTQDIYYDGKKIKDFFILTDTYRYQTNGGDYRTVPAYVRYSELYDDGTAKNKDKPEIEQLTVEVFQTLSDNIALANTSNYDVVRIDTKEEVLYDGKKLSGKFVLIDTYSYETKNGNIKTVPVYAKESEWKGKSTKEKKASSVIISAEIFQTLTPTDALARTSDWDVIKLETDHEDVYYDGKKVSGAYVMIGTYKYTTKQEIDKTVPVYIKESEYRKLFGN